MATINSYEAAFGLLNRIHRELSDALSTVFDNITDYDEAEFIHDLINQSMTWLLETNKNYGNTEREQKPKTKNKAGDSRKS